MEFPQNPSDLWFFNSKRPTTQHITSEAGYPTAAVFWRTMGRVYNWTPFSCQIMTQVCVSPRTDSVARMSCSSSSPAKMTVNLWICGWQEEEIWITYSMNRKRVRERTNERASKRKMSRRENKKRKAGRLSHFMRGEFFTGIIRDRPNY